MRPQVPSAPRPDRPAAARLTLAALVTAAGLLAAPAAVAQTRPAAQPPSAGSVPAFWDPRRRPERPDLGRLNLIRFMTEVDYPPFNYAGPDGNPAGFNVDLARLICEELHVSCTVQMRRFDTLFDALNENRGDAAIASISVTPEARRRADFSDPYYRPVARFVVRREAAMSDVMPERMEGKKIAVVAGTAHEQYLRALFTEAEVRPYRTAEAARASASPSGSTARIRAAAASSPADPSPRAAISARASASRSSAATRPCAWRPTGRSFACGRKAASPICGCAIFRSIRFEECRARGAR